MTVMRFDPFRELDRLTEQVLTGPRAARTMPMTAYRRGDDLYVALDIPGVDPINVDVTVERNVVTIRAERQSPLQEGDEVLIDERPYGRYSRQLFLGDNLDVSKLSARLEMGVLQLHIPVVEAAKPRRVEIGAQESQSQTIEAGSREAGGGGTKQQASAAAAQAGTASA